MFLTPIYFKMFLICEFNSDLHEIFKESLELIWKNVHQVLWDYLKSFKNCGEFILSDGFLVHSMYLYIYIYLYLYLSIYIYIYLYLYIYLNLFIIICKKGPIIWSSQYFRVDQCVTIFVKQLNTLDLTLHSVSCLIVNHSDVMIIFSNDSL